MTARILFALLLTMATAEYQQGSVLLAQTLWKKVIGGTDADEPSSVCALPDGSSIIAGYTRSNTNEFTGMAKGSLDGYLVKVDNQGNMIWAKLIGGSKADRVNQAVLADNGCLIIVGTTESNDGDFSGQTPGGVDMFLAKVDSTGKVLWSKTYGGTGEDVATSVTALPNGGWALVGSTNSNDGDFAGTSRGLYDAVVIKVDESGVPIWKRVIGGTRGDRGFSVASTSDSCIVATGYTQSNDGDFAGLAHGGFDDLDVFCVRYDLTGNLKWNKTFGGSNSDWGTALASAPDGGVAITGYTHSGNGDFNGLARGSFDIFVLRVDSQGSLIWTYTFNSVNEDRGRSISEAADGGWLVAGITYSTRGNLLGAPVLVLADAVVFKLNSLGQLRWYNTFGGSAHDDVAMVRPQSNGDVIVTGTTFSNDGDFAGLTRGGSDTYIVGIADTDIPCLINILQQPQSLSVNDGQYTSLTLSVNNQVGVSYQWQRKVGDNFVSISNGGPYSGATTSKLAIESAQESRKGPYRCVVTSIGGCSAVSNEAILTVGCTCDNRDVQIGQQYAGGVVYHTWKENGVQQGYVVATNDQSNGVGWSNLWNVEVGSSAQSWDAGMANSVAIVNQSGHVNSAAKLCLDLVSGGYDDWYLPGRNELSKIYVNLQKVNEGLAKVSNATPISIASYWSSSEQLADHAFSFDFGGDRYVNCNKLCQLNVRAVRKFVIQ